MKTNNLPFFYNKETLHFINDFEKLKKGVFRKLKSSFDAIDNVVLTCNKKNLELNLT